MDKRTANKSQPPCQSWGGQNVWSTTSTQGSFLNTPSNSQQLSAGLVSAQRSFYDHLQVSDQSCVNELNAILSGNNPHQSNPFKASHVSSGPSSNALFNATIPNTSSVPMSFHQQASLVLPTVNKGQTVPPKSHPQLNQQPQHLPFHSSQTTYKESFQPSVISQNLPLGLQDLSTAFPSCGQRVTRSQVSFEGANVDSAVFSGCDFGDALSSSEEQPQWTSSSHSRGAGRRSVNKAAAPVNKRQKLNVDPQVDGEKRRSAILHQRAQLLKQLAEMNKLLEKIPQDDGSGEESPPHSAAQSCPEDDCQSPESCDEQEQEETSDVPDNQSLSGESEQNASDADSDYGPPSDPPVNVPSDSDIDLDESSQSSCSSFEGETHPQSSKKQPKPGRSPHEDENSSPATEPCDADPKPTGIELLSTEGRRYAKRNYCLFCSCLVSKVARHLETNHSDRAEVAEAFQHPKHSKERKMIWSKLRNEGNIAHNKKVLKTGTGKIIVRSITKTLKVTDYIHCIYCRSLYAKKSMFMHMRRCPENKKEKEPRLGRQSVGVRCVLEASEDIEVSDGLRKILCGMQYDDVTRTILHDKILLQFGEQMFDHYSADAKRNSYLKQNLRLLGRLVMEAAKTTPLKNLEEFFCLSSFRHVVSTVNAMAGYDPESKTYKVPSVAVKVGYHLQKACSIVEDNAVKCGDDSMAKSARRFLSAYEKKWNKLVSASALANMREAKQMTDGDVPNVQDVKRLFFHIENVLVVAEEKLREAPSAENYAALAKAVLSQIILFNRRKGLQVSAVQLEQFASLKTSAMVDDMDVMVTDLERTMCSFFSRVDIRVSSGQIVPILLKPLFVSTLKLLVQVREKCGVPSQNPYLFGSPHTLTAYRGPMCIRRYLKELGLASAKALTLQKIQQHYGTMLQMMALSDDEADRILGPNNQVQALRQNSNMRLDDEIGAQNVAKQLSSNQNNLVRTKSSDKRKWNEAEVKAVEKHLMPFIQEHKLPHKDDCLACLVAETALKKRTWKGVKDYVRNRIITLQRQGRSTKASSAKRPQEVKQRQGTRRTAKAQRTKSKDEDVILTGPKKKNKHKWGEEEVQAVERHMMRFIRGHKVPQKDDCLKCLSAETDALKTRTWKGVKDYVRNRIITLQRVGVSPKTFHTDSVNSTKPQRGKPTQKTPRTRDASFTAPSRSGTSKDKGSTNKDRHKWGEEEVQAVERHMMRFIQGLKVPQKDDCLRCLSAESDVLRTRTWRGVKDYVRNRITSLKRQSGSSWSSYSYACDQAEADHSFSTVHYQQLW